MSGKALDIFFILLAIHDDVTNRGPVAPAFCRTCQAKIKNSIVLLQNKHWRELPMLMQVENDVKDWPQL